MLQNTESDLIDAVFSQIALEIVRARNFGRYPAEWTLRPRVPVSPATCIIFLECNAPRVYFRVTLHARRQLRCCSNRWRRVRPFSSAFSAGTFGGGSAGGSAMIFLASHAPRFTGFDSRPSDSPAIIADCVRMPPRSGRPCGNATNRKPFSVLSARS